MTRRYAWNDAIDAEMLDAMSYILGDFEPPRRKPKPPAQHFYASLTGDVGTTIPMRRNARGVWVRETERARD